jgi:hypothetical protein
MVLVALFCGAMWVRVQNLPDLSERIKIKCANLGLAKKDKQLDERKLSSFFAKTSKTNWCGLF